MQDSFIADQMLMSHLDIMTSGLSAQKQLRFNQVCDNHELTFLVVGDQGFGDGLADGCKTQHRSLNYKQHKKPELNGSFRKQTIDLCDASTPLHPDSDVNASEALLPQQQHRLQKLQGQKKADTHTDQHMSKAA